MKRLFFIILILILLFSTTTVFAQPVYSEEAAGALPEIQITDNRAIFSFADLGLTSGRKLQGPLSDTSVLFSLPTNWQLIAGGTLTLQFDAIINEGNRIEGDSAKNISYVVGANLIVELNNVLIGSVTLDRTGSFTQQFVIPPEALKPQLADGRHILRITLDGRLGCNYNLNSSVNIKLDSVFDLAFQQMTPKLDLSKLPSPFYLYNSILADSTLLVLRDNPDAVELQAAMNVIAGFGSMISRDYNLQIVNYSSLDEATRSQNHLIFIGLPQYFSVLPEVNFHIPVRNGKFEGVPNQSVDDGLLQLGISPWNPSKVIMLISGNSEESLSKAAYAVSTGNVLIYQNPEVAYVSNVQFLSSEIPAIESFTLEDLGYATQKLDGGGRVSTEFIFHASRSQIASKESYIELTYNHSGSNDYSNSTFSLYMNGNVFFTKIFTEESEQVTTLQIKIPPGFLRYGRNLLEIEADLLELPGCDENAVLDPWFSVSNQTRFSLPVAEDGQLSQLLLRDFKFFPELFSTSSDLSEVTFVIPPNNLDAWQIAAKISYMLGTTVQPGISNIKVAYGDEVTEDIRNTQSMIVIGKPDQIPFVAEINDKLPAPFDLTTNIASEKQLIISYRIPQGQDVGYLELIASPYNNEKTILLVAGNTDAGVSIAGNTLIEPDLQDQLAGVFAVTNGTQIATGSGNATFSIVGEGVPDAQQEDVSVVSPQKSALPLPVPSWLLPFIIVTFVIVLIVGIIVLRSFLLKNKVPRIQDDIFSKMDDNLDEEDENTNQDQE